MLISQLHEQTGEASLGRWWYIRTEAMREVTRFLRGKNTRQRKEQVQMPWGRSMTDSSRNSVEANVAREAFLKECSGRRGQIEHGHSENLEFYSECHGTGLTLFWEEEWYDWFVYCFIWLYWEETAGAKRLVRIYKSNSGRNWKKYESKKL